MRIPYRPSAVSETSSLGERVAWLINLRWLAILIVFGVVTFASQVMGVHLQLGPMYLVGGVLALLNVVFFLTCRILRIAQDRGGKRVRILANVQITTDLLVLAALIHFSGGVENPFAFYFIFHVIVSGTLLSSKDAWAQAGVSILLFCGMVELERAGLIKHHHVPGLASPTMYLNKLYVTATIVAFASTICLAVFTAISITRLVRAQQRHSDTLVTQLQQAYAELGELERSKSRYMHKVSHELRAPLAAIQNLLKLLEDQLTGEGNSNERGLLVRAGKRTDQALKLVSDLLTLAGSQDAKFNLEIKEVSLDRAISEAVGTVRPRADAAGVSLKQDLPKDLPSALGDAESLEQLFTNLTANAVKYTPKGGHVTVTASADGDHIIVKVSDTGIGISEDDLPHVFDEFYRAKNAREFAEQGTGLGLSIVKSIASAHGARIRVDSSLGQGTTFEVTIPKAGAGLTKTATEA